LRTFSPFLLPDASWDKRIEANKGQDPSPQQFSDCAPKAGSGSCIRYAYVIEVANSIISDRIALYGVTVRVPDAALVPVPLVYAEFQLIAASVSKLVSLASFGVYEATFIQALTVPDSSSRQSA
jgi:hypothetical protein